jgi:hypothetical protein
VVPVLLHSILALLLLNLERLVDKESAAVVVVHRTETMEEAQLEEEEEVNCHLKIQNWIRM